MSFSSAAASAETAEPVQQPASDEAISAQVLHAAAAEEAAELSAHTGAPVETISHAQAQVQHA